MAFFSFFILLFDFFTEIYYNGFGVWASLKPNKSLHKIDTPLKRKSLAAPLPGFFYVAMHPQNLPVTGSAGIPFILYPKYP